MDAKLFNAIVEKAQSDAGFFHSLVFAPEKALGQIDGMSRKERGAVVSTSPEEIIARLIGEVSWCDVTCTSSCGATCTGSSCGYTTNLTGRGLGAGGAGPTGWCDVTCTSSCGGTCTGSSCGYTTNLTGDNIRVSEISTGVGSAAGCTATCTSSCGGTCTGSSCGYTTNLTGRLGGSQIAGGIGRGQGIGPMAGCDVTCTSSCGGTCNQSCGYTTNLVDRFSAVSTPVRGY